jgi:hypothetical protein
MFVGNDGCGCCDSYKCRTLKFNNYHKVYTPGRAIDSLNNTKEGATNQKFNKQWFWDESPWWQSFTGTSVRTEDATEMNGVSYISGRQWAHSYYRLPPTTATDEDGKVWWNFAYDQITDLAERRVNSDITYAGSDGKYKKSFKFSIGFSRPRGKSTDNAGNLIDELDPHFTGEELFIKTTILDSDTGVILYEDNGRTIKADLETRDGFVGENSTLYYDIVIDADDELPENIDVLYWLPLPKRSDFVDEGLEQEMAGMYADVEQTALDLAKEYPEEWNWISERIGAGYGAFYCVFFKGTTPAWWMGAHDPEHPYIGNTFTGEGSENGIPYTIDNGWLRAEGYEDGQWDWEQYENGYEPPLRRYFLDHYLPLYVEATKERDAAEPATQQWIVANEKVVKYEKVLEYGDKAYEADSILAIKIIFQINQWQTYINFGHVRKKYLVPVNQVVDGRTIESKRYTWLFPEYGLLSRWSSYSYKGTEYFNANKFSREGDENGNKVPLKRNKSKSFTLTCLRVHEDGWSSMDYYRPDKMRRNRKFFTRASGSELKINISAASYRRALWEYKRILESKIELGEAYSVYAALYEPPTNTTGTQYSFPISPHWRGFYSNKFIEDTDIDTSLKVRVFNIVNKSDGTEELVMTHYYQADTSDERLYTPFKNDGSLYDRIDATFKASVTSNVDTSNVANTGEFIIEIECGDDVGVEVEMVCPRFGCIDRALNDYRLIKKNYEKIIKIFPIGHSIWNTYEYRKNLSDVTYGNPYTYVPTDERAFYIRPDGLEEANPLVVSNPWRDLRNHADIDWEQTMEDNGIEPVNFGINAVGRGTAIKSGIREILVELESEDYEYEVTWGYELWKCNISFPRQTVDGKCDETSDTISYELDFITPLGWAFDKIRANKDFREDCFNSIIDNPWFDPEDQRRFCEDACAAVSIDFQKVDTIKKKTVYKFPGSKYTGTFSLKIREGNNKVFEYVFDDVQNDCQLSVGQEWDLYEREGEGGLPPELEYTTYDHPELPKFNQQSRIYTYADPDYNCGIWGLFNGFTSVGDGSPVEDGSYNWDWINLNNSHPTTASLPLAMSQPLYQPHAGITSMFTPVGRKNLNYQNTAWKYTGYGFDGPNYSDNLLNEPRVSGWIDRVKNESLRGRWYQMDHYTLRDYYRFQEDKWQDGIGQIVNVPSEMFFFSGRNDNIRHFGIDADSFGRINYDASINIILDTNIEGLSLSGGQRLQYGYPREGDSYYNILTKKQNRTIFPELLEYGCRNVFTNFRRYYDYYQTTSRLRGDQALADYKLWMELDYGERPWTDSPYWYKEYPRMNPEYKRRLGSDFELIDIPTRSRFIFECTPGEKNWSHPNRIELADALGLFHEMDAITKRGGFNNEVILTDKIIPLDIGGFRPYINGFAVEVGNRFTNIEYQRHALRFVPGGTISPHGIPPFSYLRGFRGSYGAVPSRYVTLGAAPGDPRQRSENFYTCDLTYHLYKTKPHLRTGRRFEIRMREWLYGIGAYYPIEHNTDYIDFYNKSVKEKGELKMVVKSVKVILDNGEVIG